MMYKYVTSSFVTNLILFSTSILAEHVWPCPLKESWFLFILKFSHLEFITQNFRCYPLFPLFPHCIWMQKEIYVMRWYGGRMTTMWGRLHKHPELLSFLVGFITSVKAQLSCTSSPASISGSCTWAPLLAASTWLTKYRHVECCTVPPGRQGIFQETSFLPRICIHPQMIPGDLY